VGVGHAARPVDVVKVVVDRTLCEGNARCVKLAPEVFQIPDDADVVEVRIDPPESMRAAVEQAIERCPRQALRLG
jgi:ferredoxin